MQKYDCEQINTSLGLFSTTVGRLLFYVGGPFKIYTPHGYWSPKPNSGKLLTIIRPPAELKCLLA